MKTELLRRIYHPLILVWFGTGIWNTTACTAEDELNKLQAPTEFKITAGGGTTIELSWQPPPEISVQDIIRYEYELDGIGTWLRMHKTPPFVINLHRRNELHMVRIRAVDKYGAGESSFGIFAAATDEDTDFEYQQCQSGGDGSISSPVIICNYHDLLKLRPAGDDDETSDDKIINTYFALGAHIDATPSFSDGAKDCDAFNPRYSPTFDTCRGWRPLPLFTNSHFDGKNYLIVGLYGNFKHDQYGGFISRMNRSSSLTNIQLRSVYFFAQKSSPAYLGGLVGSVKNSRVASSSVMGGVLTSKSVVGGLIGLMGEDEGTSTLVNAYADKITLLENKIQPLKITGQTAGGLAGISRRSHLHSVTATATLSPVTTTNNRATLGGLVGQLDKQSTLEYATVESSLSPSATSGSLVGSISADSTIKAAIEYKSDPELQACGGGGDNDDNCNIMGGVGGFILSVRPEFEEPKFCIRNCPCLNSGCSGPVFQERSILALPGYIK